MNVSRNDALEFGRRVRANLEHIEQAFGKGDVHVVTQLGISLLGLIVVPQERHFVDVVKGLKVDQLASAGWPQWTITLGTCDTLGELVYHLRNAVAHGHLTFSSDSPHLKDVEIAVEDYKPKATEAYWRAHIGASDLRTFCMKFLELLDDTIA